MAWSFYKYKNLLKFSTKVLDNNRKILYDINNNR